MLNERFYTEIQSVIMSIQPSETQKQIIFQVEFYYIQILRISQLSENSLYAIKHDFFPVPKNGN